SPRTRLRIPTSPPPSRRSANRNAPMSRTPSASSKRQVRSGNRAMTHARLNLPMSEPVLLDRAGPVATLTLKRPDVLNTCDFVIAADNAYFTSAYRHIALTPDGGGSWALPRIVGLRKAMEILLLSERFDAAEALRLGLVNKVVTAEALDAETDNFVRALAT